MSRTVFILGAGASAQAGAPTMATFVQFADDLRRGASLASEDAKDFDLVFRARSKLQSVFSKSQVDINNMESLFGIFEMAALIRKLGNLSEEEVTRLPLAMSKVIARTIEAKVQYPVGGEYPRVLPPTPYGQFTEMLADLARNGDRSISVITFNYDVALDYALHFHGVPIDYCLGESRETGRLHLLKLHGSLNWSHCQKCKEITPYYFGDYFRKYSWQLELASKPVLLEISKHLQSHSHCGAPLLEQPVIVPPTWNKGRSHSALSRVWCTAASHLSEAERVFVIGYSLPPTDEFFRYFYALGSVGDSIPRLFCIVDTNSEPSTRFRQILGPLVLNPPCFHTIQNTFGASLKSIRDLLGLAASTGGRPLVKTRSAWS